MTRINRLVRRTAGWGLVGSLAIAIPLLFGSAQAQDDETEGHLISHVTSMQSTAVGDAEGHTIDVVQELAIITDPTGEVAYMSMTTIVDDIKGVGSIRGYWSTTYPDGSKTMGSHEGAYRPADGGTDLVIEGNWTCLGGAGRFAGATGGGGPYTGQRVGMWEVGSDTNYVFTGVCEPREQGRSGY